MLNSCAKDLTSGISVVIPVFNSRESLATLVARLASSLCQMRSEYEILLVNDCSQDDSWQVIQGISLENIKVRGFSLAKNYGQHNALLCGIRQAKYDIIITMDDDLQHPPEEIHKLVQKLQEGYDVVYGVPETRHHGMFRDSASIITKYVLKYALGVAIATDVSAFRALKTDIRAAFEQYKSALVSIDVLLTWGAGKIGSVTVQHSGRIYGKSSYNIRSLLKHFINMITGFSVVPLKMVTFIGVIFSLLGVGVLLYVLVRYMVTGFSVPGFPFLASIIAIFSGVQLLSLGIIGEYLGRMYYRMIDQPAYVVKQAVGDNKKKSLL